MRVTGVEGGQANTKDCPKCKVAINKDGGCNHMHCKQAWAPPPRRRHSAPIHSDASTSASLLVCMSGPDASCLLVPAGI